MCLLYCWENNGGSGPTLCWFAFCQLWIYFRAT
ncbi:hypothetical protein QE331_gp067 [Pseudomonas phage 20Sep416]|uniref:Uncharacterized protein n=2 Tax=Pakpunavirus TaxID=1921407 RepID=A0AAF0FMJ1_9CAUD|nr:hypothetical protein QE325_gp145 [Pseudomonas phage pPA-3099-2aT.2]YP_010763591.1 hypothetical protein QE331_gp067 [Pseudomonas phage 20Sep416]WBQ35236.1 hypothetical protein [Pseudomonas phage pPA-3099-2aT.2]WFG37562.1 hypothetical protein 20Sep416_00067 [Pseudomonas phage 20Sep416]